MTGPEHYKEAERLLGSLAKMGEEAQRLRAGGREYGIALQSVIAEAQVHATLALAAASAARNVKELLDSEKTS